MHAESELLIGLMFDNKRQYQIPVYQRNYDWKKNNCLELFNDVFNAYEKSRIHFMGTIVQVQQDEEEGLKHFVIVDGQQRMTSIYLLLKALYDKTKEEGTKDELRGLLFNNSSSRDFNKQEKNKLKLKPIKSDNVQFLHLMNDEIDEMDKASNIYINYIYFCKLIDEKLQNEYMTKNILAGLKKLQIVMISLKEPDDDPQVIFERINSTGEDLKLADLVRNYLLMTDKNMDSLFDNYWIPIEARLGRDNINEYFLTYFIFKIGEIKEKDAYQAFKKWADDGKFSHENILKDMRYFSKFYAAFIGIDNDYSERINNYLAAYRNLKQSTIYQFLFPIFDDFENKVIDEDTLCKILLFYINYIIRRLVVGIPSNSLRGLYRTLYKRIFKNPSQKDTYLDSIYNFMANDLALTKDATPNDTIFKDKLMSENLYQNKPLCKYILSILENGISGIKEAVNIGSETTIEHIMPQNKDNIEWQNMVGDDYDLVYEKYLHTLGNLSLTGYNSELSDKNLSEKIKLIREKSKFAYLNADVIDKNKWNKKTITDRANRLSTKLLSELKLPNVFGAKSSIKTENTHRVDDVAVDYSNMKPCAFILLGEKVNVSSSREMITKFIEKLYEIDQEQIYNMAANDFKSPGAQCPLLTLDSLKLRSSSEISNSGIYVETNRSFNATIRMIKLLLDKFDLEYDDFIFYTTNE